MALRRVTIHRAGIRPHLFLGGDRELVLFSGLIAFVLTVPSFQWAAISTGIALWMVALFVLRLMVKPEESRDFWDCDGLSLFGASGSKSQFLSTNQ